MRQAVRKRALFAGDAQDRLVIFNHDLMQQRRIALLRQFLLHHAIERLGFGQHRAAIRYQRYERHDPGTCDIDLACLNGFDSPGCGAQRDAIMAPGALPSTHSAGSVVWSFGLRSCKALEP